MRLTLLLLLTGIMLLPSCFKEDERVTPHPRGDLRSDTIPMTENYLYQVWYSLDSGQIARSIVKTTYDLGFECAENGWHIILNTSNFMKVADLGVVEFGIPHDTTGLKLKFDKSDGDADSTAIGEWFKLSGSDTLSNGHVYAISRGIDELGNPLGVYQVVFDSLKNGNYYFRYVPLAGGTVRKGQAGKDRSYTYRYFSFSDGSVISADPPQTGFDLLFTQYTTMLYTDEGIPYPYLVTGVLLNRFRVEAAPDTLTAFEDISRDMAVSLKFSKALDVIGYEWKDYDFNSGVYTITPKRSYVIRSVSGYLYKLRFVAFYSKEGLKGYPVIEFQAL